MKLKLFTKFIALSTVPILGVVASCSKNEVKNENETQKGKEQTLEKENKNKTYDVEFSNNILSTDLNSYNKYNEFIEGLNEIPKLSNEYNKINVRVPKLELNEVFEKEYFEREVITKINNVNLKFNIDEPESSLITLNPKTETELKEVEKLLQKNFNNYYVNKSWFEGALKDKIEKAKPAGLKGKLINNGKITLEKSKEKGKLKEYNDVVNEIKEFLKKHNVIIDDNIKISEINQNIKSGWSLNIKLKSTNLESKSIKLDFKKPDAELTEEQLKNKNLSNSITKKVKLKVNEFLDGPKIKGFFKFVKFLVLVDKNGVLSIKITDVIYEILSKVIQQLDFIPSFLAKITIQKLRPQVEKFVDKVVLLLRGK
ncbi:hypothetical protein [Mycoplasmopsis cynos]|uniref:hypothetical protein n=1 Tax=Mycoplasmopsis cynos TaxID=171284 RepID=UPI00220D077E|nr:hypothetical protein [Mycoplasmopsis cynos]UWV92342.1 hypothetical protein NWE57_05760 [Mycoplasmopsis cynos]